MTVADRNLGYDTRKAQYNVYKYKCKLIIDTIEFV
jgi:hypothetical protein